MSLSLSRRHVLGIAGAGLAASALSSCSGSLNGDAGGSGSTDFVRPVTIEAPTVEGLITSSVEGVPPMMVGSPKEYFQFLKEKPAKGGSVSTFQIMYNTPPLGKDKNKVWAELTSQLGLDELNITMAPDATFNDKLATLLASGDLPDLVYLNDTNPNAARALKDGAFTPLNEFIEGDLVKEYAAIATTPATVWDQCQKDGAILGIPQPGAALDWFPNMRTDAMKTIGADKAPETGQQLGEMLAEFAKIGKLGGRQVWAVGGLNAGDWESIHKVGPTLQLSGDNKVVTKFSQPNYEEHLAWMADLWKKKVFHPDALGQIDPELFAQGQQLYYFASFAGLYWVPAAGRVNVMREAVPGADVIHFVPPAIDGGPGSFTLNRSYYGMVCVSTDKAKGNKDRIKELLRIMNWHRTPFGSKEQLFKRSGIEGRQYTFGPENAIAPIENAPNEGAVTFLGVQANQVNSMPTMNKDKVEMVTQTLEGMVKAGKHNPLVLLQNDAMIKNSAKLDELVKDYYTGIVSGRRPVSDAKKLQDDYLKNGGQAVIDEYQKALEAAK